MTDKLQMAEAKKLKVSISEISNGFIVTRDGDHTFYPTYSEAFAILAVPRAMPRPRTKKEQA